MEIPPNYRSPLAGTPTNGICSPEKRRITTTPRPSTCASKSNLRTRRLTPMPMAGAGGGMSAASRAFASRRHTFLATLDEGEVLTITEKVVGHIQKRGEEKGKRAADKNKEYTHFIVHSFNSDRFSKEDIFEQFTEVAQELSGNTRGAPPIKMVSKEKDGIVQIYFEVPTYYLLPRSDTDSRSRISQIVSKFDEMVKIYQIKQRMLIEPITPRIRVLEAIKEIILKCLVACDAAKDGLPCLQSEDIMRGKVYYILNIGHFLRSDVARTEEEKVQIKAIFDEVEGVSSKISAVFEPASSMGPMTECLIRIPIEFRNSEYLEAMDVRVSQLILRAKREAFSPPPSVTPPHARSATPPSRGSLVERLRAAVSDASDSAELSPDLALQTTSPPLLPSPSREGLPPRHRGALPPLREAKKTDMQVPPVARPPIPLYSPKSGQMIRPQKTGGISTPRPTVETDP